MICIRFDIVHLKHYDLHNCLYANKRVQTGERPYACKLCGTTFRLVEHLKYHEGTKVIEGHLFGAKHPWNPLKWLIFIQISDEVL